MPTRQFLSNSNKKLKAQIDVRLEKGVDFYEPIKDYASLEEKCRPANPYNHNDSKIFVMSWRGGGERLKTEDYMKSLASLYPDI